MTLKNTTVTFTVVIPSVDVDSELGLQIARTVVIFYARDCVNDHFKCVETKITDCPDYPALCQ